MRESYVKVVIIIDNVPEMTLQTGYRGMLGIKGVVRATSLWPC